jgi:hypothetical protein
MFSAGFCRVMAQLPGVSIAIRVQNFWADIVFRRAVIADSIHAAFGHIHPASLPALRVTMLPLLAPIIDHVSIAPIESVCMRTLHGNPLHYHLISMGAHALIGIFPSKIHASFYRRSAGERKRLASVQQFIETPACACITTDRAELDVTNLLATLRSWSVQAYRKSIENIPRVCQHHVASALRKDGLDFSTKIESLINVMGEFLARLNDLFALFYCE